ncbi:hypothetical protein NECAME_04044 [Necator americanus]|uniref:Uncharacterized protein n=1 Tax=Necator americanus TaxID=51031 RepID=W2SXK8_NECAM|nr:hypothetical protein NECAME_04044 [Necator americanus]ETN74365.1 hypothetical protein NECAME_04044 [Necator americanus]
MDETFNIKFVDQQAFLNKELEEVMRQIKDKEDMLTKTVENQKNVDELMKKHQQEMSDLQQRIDALLAEKSRLEADLKKISVNNRLAEERRRKLQEMEKQLAQFRKQMNEMKKLEKQRQQSEETQKRMQAEIVELKKAKIRMVKQQREEAEKYRQWKTKHDRELHQLKQKERKRDVEAAREKRVHDQQMLVYRQKLEDASKVNKRLIAQMERAAAFSREKPESEKSLSHAKQFIETELALVGSSYEAELMCQSLKDQRRHLGRKKTSLQRQKERYLCPDEPLSKRRSTEQGPALTTEDEETLNKIDEELNNIEQQQILCSDELNKLQRGCGTIDVDSRSETRWKELYTVAAARIYLKVLFEQAANERRAVIDMEKEQKQMKRKIKELENDIRDVKRSYEGQINEIHEKNRSLAFEFDKQKSDAEMHYLNLMARLNACKMVDTDVLNEFKRISEDMQHAIQLSHQMKNTKTFKRRSSRAKPLMRSQSSSSVDPALITTEEERRTRSSRARIHRYGDVRNPIQLVEPASDEDESVVDTSYHPDERHHHERRKKPLTIPDDVNPLGNATLVSGLVPNLNPTLGPL